MSTKHDRMYAQILQHGKNLQTIGIGCGGCGMGTKIEPVEIAKKLHALEIKAHKIATDYCNGILQEKDRDAEIVPILQKLNSYMPENVFKQIYVNFDCRGYALKLQSEYAATIKIYRDWGGYGILAPEFDGN